MIKAMYGRFAAACAFVLLLGSCAGPQQTIYFKDYVPQDPTVQTQRMDKVKEAIVQPDDILAINVSTISSLSEQTPVTMFDGGTPVAITSSIGGGVTGKGYLVDANGFIDFPVIGKQKVAGSTLRQVKDLLASKLKEIVTAPVVEARIINYRVTVLGEVGRPGTVIAPNQKISIVDALAAAGDIPLSGRKDNVLIVRETEGVREYARLNLNSKEVFGSPYFYLKQNDLVYVEPSKIRRQERNEFLRFYLPTITSLLSAAIAVYSISLIRR